MTLFRRRFVDVSHGQMHLRSAGDPGLPPLVMFHPAPATGYTLLPLARHLAAGRHVILVDTAGNGDSAPLPQADIGVAELAAAHWEVIEGLGLGTVDLYGSHTGASICAELSIGYGDRIRRVVMDGLSVFEQDDIDNLIDHEHAPPIMPDLDGTQLAKVWSMIRDAWLFWPWWDRRQATRRALDLPAADVLHNETIEFLKGCTTYHHNYNAGICYPKRARLPLVRNPVLVTACPSDQFVDHLERGVALMPGARAQLTPDRDKDGGAEAAALMLGFLNEP